MTTVTIGGAANQGQSVSLNSSQTTALAQQVANSINAAAASGTLNANQYPGPFIPGSGVNEAVIPTGAGPGPYVGPVGYQYVVNAATGPVSLTGAPNQTVLSGIGGTTFNAAGSNDLILGGGTNAVSLSGANNTINLADGSNTIYGGSSSDSTINAGIGNVSMFGSSSGSEVFLSSGNNTLFEGAGADTLVAGSGATTVFGGTGGSVLYGGSGPLLLVADRGPTTVVGGSAGATLFGAAGGDLTYAGRSGALYVAGLGNETLNAATSSGNNLFYGARAGNAAVILAGSGNDTIVGNTGYTDMTGGSGSDVFAFFRANGGGVDIVRNFTPKDEVLLAGYGANATTNTTVVGGSTILTLSDNTTITFSGLSNLNSSQIVKT